MVEKRERIAKLLVMAFHEGTPDSEASAAFLAIRRMKISIEDVSDVLADHMRKSKSTPQIRPAQDMDINIRFTWGYGDFGTTSSTL